MVERIEGALARSPADETAISVLETWRRRSGPQPAEGRRSVIPERNVLVRVLEGGRPGLFRGGSLAPADLDGAVRHAMAHARGQQVIPGLPHVPGENGATPDAGPIHDPEIADLTAAAAAELVAGAGDRARRSLLEWGESQLVVVSTRGAVRAARATRIQIDLRWDDEGATGWASSAARRLAAFDRDRTAERARGRIGAGERRTVSGLGVPLALAPEAVAALIDVINRRSLTAQAYQSGESFLREHLGVQVFDRRLSLVDDPLDRSGLPFPFDLEGSPKRRVAMVAEGVPRTPALDQLHAAVLGLPATPQACAGDDARAEHLAVAAGEDTAEEVIGAADGGVWGGRLERVECYDPRRLMVRAVVRGARRIRDGVLAEPLQDLVWDAPLLLAFGKIRVGNDRITVADPSGGLGGLTAPTVALLESGRLEPA